MNILIIEDDIKIAEALSTILDDHGYNTDVVYDGVEGLYYGNNGNYEVIILDVMLPKMDGFDVLKLLRTQNIKTPILMLTAKSDIVDKVRGLNLGADDYMTKPFSPEELLARVKSITRRGNNLNTEQLTYGDIVVDKNKYIISKNSKKIDLNRKEMSVLSMLINNDKQIISKEQIIVKVWGNDSNITENNVEAYISFLRKKLYFIDSDVLIKSVRNVGYKLEYHHD